MIFRLIEHQRSIEQKGVPAGGHLQNLNVRILSFEPLYRLGDKCSERGNALARPNRCSRRHARLERLALGSGNQTPR